MERLDSDRRNYIASEMATVNSTTPPRLAIAFRSPDFLPGTKWMNITQEEFKAIERILTLGNER
jgi:hypothetical protein